MGKEEINSLAKDINEIKLLLFCQLILSHTSQLPAALRASSIEEFLNDPDITQSDLRDLCLRVEQPSLQDIRDACADHGRGDEQEVDEEEHFEAEETIEDVGGNIFQLPLLFCPSNIPRFRYPAHFLHCKLGRVISH